MAPIRRRRHVDPGQAAVRPLDHLLDAAGAGRYLALEYQITERRWLLRELDDATGELSEPIATSPIREPHIVDATVWANTLPATAGIYGWRGPDAIAPEPGLIIEESFHILREITRTGRPGRRELVLRLRQDPHRPGEQVAVVRERWTASGAESVPLGTHSCSEFGSHQEMLTTISKWYGVEDHNWHRENDAFVCA